MFSPHPMRQHLAAVHAFLACSVFGVSCAAAPLVPTGTETWQARVEAPAGSDLAILSTRIKARLAAAGAVNARVAPRPAGGRYSPGSLVATQLGVTVPGVASEAAPLLRYLVTAPGRFGLHELVRDPVSGADYLTGGPLLGNRHIERVIETEDPEVLWVVPTPGGRSRMASFEPPLDGPMRCSFLVDGVPIGDSDDCALRAVGNSRAWRVRVRQKPDLADEIDPARLLLIPTSPLPGGLKIVEPAFDRPSHVPESP